MIKVLGVTHWAIPVNNLEESEHFYHDVLGLEKKGSMGDRMACFAVGENIILLCERGEPVLGRAAVDAPMHHAFTIAPASFEDSCRLLFEEGIYLDRVEYRDRGFFKGRELYFNDPSGNRIELRDETWEPGMPTPSLEEIIGEKRTPSSA